MAYTREELTLALQEADANQDITAVNELVGMLDALPKDYQYTQAVEAPNALGSVTGAVSGAAQEAAGYFGYGPYAEVKRVPLDDGTTRDLTRASEISLAFDLGTNDFIRWGRMVDALAPTGGYVDSNGERVAGRSRDLEGAFRYATPEELHGEEFINAGFDRRMEIINEKAEQGVLSDGEHALTDAAQRVAGVDATSAMIGSLGKELLTPTIALPIGKSLPAMSAIGGAVAGQMEGSRQLAGETEKDLGSLVKATLFGAVASPVIGAPLRTAGAVLTTPVKIVRAVNKAVKSPPTINSTKRANRVVAKLERKFEEKVAEGLSEEQILIQSKNELGITDEKMVEVLARASRQPEIPSVEVAINNIRIRSNPLESTTRIGKGFDYIASPLSATVRKISEPVFGALRKFEMRQSINVSKSTNIITPYLIKTQQIISKEKDPARLALLKDMERDLMNGKFLSAARKAEAEFPDIAKQLVSKDGKPAVLKTLLDDIHTRAKAVGIKVSYLENYFPRTVKDLEGLKEALGSSMKNPIEKALEKAAKKKGAAEVADLTDDEVAEVINQVLQRRAGGGVLKKSEAGRTVSNITPEIQEFYHDASTSLALYVNRMEREIAKREFFHSSKSLVETADGVVDIDKSIGSLLAKERVNLNPTQEDRLSQLLNIRFTQGEKAMGSVFATARDLQTMALLANIDSALIQLADVGSSVYVNGLSNTIKALTTSNKASRITVEELGLLNKVSAEFNNADGFSKWTTKLMKGSGFARVDRLGKDTLLQASLLKAEKLSISNPQILRDKYGKVFGDEMGDLVSDLQNGKMSENVKLYLWNELSDVQPISLSEMPAAYLKTPNGRILYALKSFGLVQLNRMRTDIVDVARAGNHEQALENAARYALSVGVMGATVEETRSLMRGKFDVEAMGTDVSSVQAAIETFPDAVTEYLMKTAFLSKYSREKHLSSGNIGSWALNTVTPAAFSIADTGGSALMEAFKDEPNIEKIKKTEKFLPIAGKIWYNWMEGGAEELVEKRKAEKLKEQRAKSLNKAR